MNQKMLKSWCPSCPQFLESLLCKGQTNTGSFSARKKQWSRGGGGGEGEGGKHI